jgi:hypothetical protein
LAADAYGLDAAGRAQLLEVLAGIIARGGEFVRRRVEAGDTPFIEMWNAMGGRKRFDRRRRWWAAEQPRFAAAPTRGACPTDLVPAAGRSRSPGNWNTF